MDMNQLNAPLDLGAILIDKKNHCSISPASLYDRGDITSLRATQQRSKFENSKRKTIQSVRGSPRWEPVPNQLKTSLKQIFH